MNKGILNRVKRLEEKHNIDNHLGEFLAAISGLSRGLPSNPVQITPERQARIENALSKITEEEAAKILSDLNR
jgi:hypothetical protein